MRQHERHRPGTNRQESDQPGQDRSHRLAHPLGRRGKFATGTGTHAPGHRKAGPDLGCRRSQAHSLQWRDDEQHRQQRRRRLGHGEPAQPGRLTHAGVGQWPALGLGPVRFGGSEHHPLGHRGARGSPQGWRLVDLWLRCHRGRGQHHYPYQFRWRRSQRLRWPIRPGRRSAHLLRRDRGRHQRARQSGHRLVQRQGRCGDGRRPGDLCRAGVRRGLVGL